MMPNQTRSLSIVPAMAIFALMCTTGCDPGTGKTTKQLEPPVAPSPALPAVETPTDPIPIDPGASHVPGPHERVVCDCACESETCKCKPLRGGGCVCGTVDFEDCQCTCAGQEAFPASAITSEFFAERQKAGIAPPPDPDELPTVLPPKPAGTPEPNKIDPAGGPVPVIPTLPAASM